MLVKDPAMKTGFWAGSEPLPDDLQWVWSAFWDLSPSRAYTPVGMGGAIPGPIPFETIDRYAARYEIEDFEAFHRMIRTMDRAYLDTIRPEEPKKDG